MLSTAMLTTTHPSILLIQRRPHHTPRVLRPSLQHLNLLLKVKQSCTSSLLTRPVKIAAACPRRRPFSETPTTRRSRGCCAPLAPASCRLGCWLAAAPSPDCLQRAAAPHKAARQMASRPPSAAPYYDRRPGRVAGRRGTRGGKSLSHCTAEKPGEAAPSRYDA